MTEPTTEAGRGQDGRPILAFGFQLDWRSWLGDHHAGSDGVWLKFAKKGSGIPSVTYAEAVDVALCFGWIDSQARGLDEVYYLQRFTPRTARSKWSKINRARVEQLIAEGSMQPAGLGEIERAKSDGRWAAAYDSPRTAVVPDDLQQALDRNAAAGEFFATLNSTNRYAILHRIADAKRPETRRRRIDQYVVMLAEHRTIHP